MIHLFDAPHAICWLFCISKTKFLSFVDDFSENFRNFLNICLFRLDKISENHFFGNFVEILKKHWFEFQDLDPLVKIPNFKIWIWTETIEPRANLVRREALKILRICGHIVRGNLVIWGGKRPAKNKNITFSPQRGIFDEQRIGISEVISELRALGRAYQAESWSSWTSWRSLILRIHPHTLEQER